MVSMFRWIVLILVLTQCSACGDYDGSPEADGRGAFLDAALVESMAEWNRVLLSAAEAEDGFLTLKGVRTTALMHLSIHDALNAIDRRYEPFAFPDVAPTADPMAALTEAAFKVASSQYADAAEFAAVRERQLAEVELGDPRTEGLELGEAAASAVLASREGDGWDGEVEYQWHPMDPGVYAEFHDHSGTPEGFIFGSGWARARPFALEDPGQFRSPPPPPIESDEYVEAFDEVKELGRWQSTSRSEDQTHLAFWWKQFVEKSHNRLARELVIEERLDAWQAARFFALLEMSIYDGYIASFDNKFLYNHWRPYTAIRWASHDGNSKTDEQPDWNNTHRHTYAFPSYPSAHGTVCAAAMSIFEEVFGTSRPVTLTIERVDSAGPFSEPMDLSPAQRSFDSFAQAAEECALSRVFLGIHFRYDSVAGTALGRQVGGYVLEHELEPTQ